MSNARHVATSIDSEITHGDSQSILSRLFRKFLYKRTNVDKHQEGSNSYLAVFNVLLERYIIRSGINQNLKEISSVRGNLKKELLKSSMSWKIFIKGMRFLGVEKFKISITIYPKYGKPHTEEETVIISDNYVTDDDDDE